MWASVGSRVAFIASYTAYDKELGRLRWSLALDTILLRRGITHSAVELNKVVSLAGLALLASAVWIDVLTEAVALLLVHGLFSSVYYYGSANVPATSTWKNTFAEARDISAKTRLLAVRKLSCILAVVAQTALLTAWLGVAPGLWWYALLFGLLHFYLMEIDYKRVLRVRPAGLLPLVGGPIALLAALWR